MIVGGTVSPNWAEEVTAIFTALTGLILLSTGVVVWIQLRETQRTRHSELIAEMTERWGAGELRSARLALGMFSSEDLRDLVKRMYDGQASLEDERLFYRLSPLPAFMEVIAVIESGVSGFKIEHIDQLWGGAILAAWAKWEPAISVMQGYPNSEHAYENFADLARKVGEYRKDDPARRRASGGRRLPDSAGRRGYRSDPSSVPPSVPDNSAGRTLRVAAAAVAVAVIGALSAILLRKRSAS